MFFVVDKSKSIKMFDKNSIGAFIDLWLDSLSLSLTCKQNQGFKQEESYRI